MFGPLHAACEAGHTAIVDVLLKRSASIEAVDGRVRVSCPFAVPYWSR